MAWMAWMARGWMMRWGEMMAARAMACDASVRASTCDFGAQPSSDCVSNTGDKMSAWLDGVYDVTMVRGWVVECESRQNWFAAGRTRV